MNHRYLLLCAFAASVFTTASLAASSIESRAALGQRLFFDPILSLKQTQSCSTCHSPEKAFTDPRDNGVNGAASLGDNGHSLGNRNAPTASYAAFSPAFHQNSKGQYRGGQFLDGRAANLADQAGGPPLNPLEMAMPDQQLVAKRLRKDKDYAEAFARLYGEAVFKDDTQLYLAMADSISAFEQTEAFSPFDSKYDRYLRGEYSPTKQEELGMTLFFSQQFTNCNLCHQLKSRAMTPGETFSDYSYHNIGVPENNPLRGKNGLSGQVDEGLLANPTVDDPQQRGRFKVPTLRNVAVTGPYMHNGVFNDLETVILFYNKYNSRSSKRQINPETGAHWAEPEVAENLSIEELKTGPALDNKRIKALIAFLKMLTDQRYEALLK